MTTMKNLIKLFCLLCFINYCFSSTPRPGLVEFEKVSLGFCVKKSQKFSHSFRLSLTQSVESEIVMKIPFFSLDIRVNVNLAFFEEIGLFLALFEQSCTGNTCHETEPQFL